MKLRIASDGIAGQQTAVAIDGVLLDDVQALQLTMSAFGLNSVVIKRLPTEGVRVELDLYGGEAFHELRHAAMRVLAEYDGGFTDVSPAIVDALRAAVSKVQDEVAG